MSYNKVVAVLAVTIAIMAIPQNIEAKIKKVKYLGHKYEGAVDNNNIPAGNGVLNIGDKWSWLSIEGNFDGQSVTEAEVRKYAYNGERETSFVGTVTFDESENVTLKAGGSLSITYYDWREKKHSKEVLEEDRVVDKRSFEPQSIKLPYFFKPRSLPSELNPPTEVTVYYTLTKENEKFMDISKSEKEKLEVLKGYKDNEGRIWDYQREGRQFSVKYPDGSFFEYNSEGYQVNFEIHYPDGKIISGDRGDLNLGNSFYIRNGAKEASQFAKYKKMTSFLYPKSPEWVYSKYYDFDILSSTEGDKIIQENLLPLITNDEPIKFEIVKSRDDMTRLGDVENGKYISRKESDAAIIAKREKANEEKYAKLCKLYGKTYVDAALNGKVIIGMPEKLFLSVFSDCRLHAQTAEGKVYYIYSLTTKSRGNKEWFAEVLSKTVLVYNGKVAKIVNHR